MVFLSFGGRWTVIFCRQLQAFSIVGTFRSRFINRRRKSQGGHKQQGVECAKKDKGPHKCAGEIAGANCHIQSPGQERGAERRERWTSEPLNDVERGRRHRQVLLSD